MSRDSSKRAGVIAEAKVGRTLSPVHPCSRNKGRAKRDGQKKRGETAVAEWKKVEKNVRYGPRGGNAKRDEINETEKRRATVYRMFLNVWKELRG